MVPPPPESRVTTKILLDVDGVLNASYRYMGRVFLVNSANIDSARSWTGTEGRVLTPCTTFAANESGISEVFVRRLALLIKKTEPCPEVILSTSWRHPRHSVRLEALRMAIQKYLGRHFMWSGATPLRKELNAADRLESMAAYLSDMGTKPSDVVRVLVLDDFLVTPFDGWSCDDAKMTSPEAAEEFLLSHCRGFGSVAVKVVHTFEEVLTAEGQTVQAALGLTREHYTTALNFLSNGGGSLLAAPAAAGLTTKFQGAFVWACLGVLGVPPVQTIARRAPSRKDLLQ